MLWYIDVVCLGGFGDLLLIVRSVPGYLHLHLHLASRLWCSGYHV